MMYPRDYATRFLFALTTLWLTLLLSTADVLAQSEAQEPGLRVWRKITLGTQNGVDGYRDALEAASIRIGDSADEILGRPAFPYSKAKTELELAVLSAAELGVGPDGAPLSDVYERAWQMKLELCPAEVGPQLRLDYRDQALGNALHIAMVPVATYHGRLTILALVNFGTGLALIGSDGRPDFKVPQAFRFVFNISARNRLEYVRRP